MKPNGKERSRDLKMDILDTAKRLFIEFGYDGATFQKIADELNITKGAITYHFKNKHFIILHVFDEYFNQIRAHISCFPDEFRNYYWHTALTYIYAYRKIMRHQQIRNLFYHHEQMSYWQSGKVNTVYKHYETITRDFHKSFTHDELLMTTYMDLGARTRIYLEYSSNPDLMTIDQYCHYHIYLLGLLARLDEHTVRENIGYAFDFADSHPFDIKLFDI